MLSVLQKEMIASVLEKSAGEVRHILDEQSIGGGSINEAYKVRTDRGVFFVKTNHAKKFPGMFAAEAKALAVLKANSGLIVPAAIGVMEKDDEAVFVSEFLESGMRSERFFFEFGSALAGTHTRTQNAFGLDHDNYIGSLRQFNSPKESWAAFFSQMRLEVQLKLARDKGRVPKEIVPAFQKLYSRLDEIFPAERPSLLHGDLWSGNYMTAPNGDACIFDPAVYFGHREMDIAMSKLFGGFDRDFYEGYNARWSLAKGWEQRVDICNLYPLLVHVNLFGGGYVNEVERIVKRFK
ncbi:MAG TPA: fructosamine kinase family protein [Bacteroidia bacterium]|jgi:fructosamine-3-kinase